MPGSGAEQKRQTKWNKPAKLFSVNRFALLYHMDEVMGEDEGDPLPLDAELGLEVAQDVAKIYVEELEDEQANQRVPHHYQSESSQQKVPAHLSGAADHDVVAVAVSDAQNVGGYTVAGTRQRELLDRSVQRVAVRETTKGQRLQHAAARVRVGVSP